METHSGLTGWCRESVDGAATLTPVGLEAGMEATVHIIGEISLQLRSGAGTLNQIVAALANGDRVTLVDGPVRDESGLWWWQVRTDEGEIGWCVDYIEGSRGAATLAPNELELGIQAAAHTVGAVGLRLRSGAGILNPVVGGLAQGERVTLIDGPVKDESGLWWWQVRTDEGEIGWCVDYFQGVQTLVP